MFRQAQHDRLSLEHVSCCQAELVEAAGRGESFAVGLSLSKPDYPNPHAEVTSAIQKVHNTSRYGWNYAPLRGAIAK